ncbi:polyketide synthase [Pseudozyma hubeiensis SY62]|uniref:Polyketide synthase n=1 Tax=Pseudozyma hubeiensis (strain SY62) TaxID=1305764 RepID=R9NZI9_PSEHS|nr:polyketide synthase [Pseudozyma hubeiensis SY62]GAC94278.1 polyketide synthase [Pseudozyma hubeiensis SY62]
MWGTAQGFGLHFRREQRVTRNTLPPLSRLDVGPATGKWEEENSMTVGVLSIAFAEGRSGEEEKSYQGGPSARGAEKKCRVQLVSPSVRCSPMVCYYGARSLLSSPLSIRWRGRLLIARHVQIL